MTTIVIDENMISLEILEWIEVKFKYDGDEKEVLLCRKPSVAQGTVLVRTVCKHLVEETAKKFPLPDVVKVDTCAQQLMVFLQAVSEFKQYVYDTKATLESLTRMEKAIKGVCPMISTYENDQSEAIKAMRNKTGQEAPREIATLELSENVVQLNIGGRAGGNKNTGNKFAWCNDLARCLHGLLIVGYDLTVSPDVMIVTAVHPTKFVTPRPVREVIEAAVVCARTVNNAEVLLKPLWENLMKSVNYEDSYGRVHSVNSVCGVIVEDIRKMTSQAQALVSVVQYRGPLGVTTKGGYVGARGGGHQSRGGRGGIFQGKGNAFRGGRGAGRGSGWGTKNTRPDSWSCPCGFMTNYADHDSCCWCGVTKTGRVGQVEIANLVHGETEVEEIDDGGNQGGVVATTVSRGGFQTRVRGRGRGRG